MHAGSTRLTVRKRIARIAVNLDASAQRPRVWLAMLAGAGLGLAWGGAARLWMRLIATDPEFSVGGTAIILVISALFGMWTGLAFAARRRGWRGWRHYLPRTLAVFFFIPFGFGGGLPLMVTVLLATIARCQSGLVGAWVTAVLGLRMGPAVLGLSEAASRIGAGAALILALALTASALMRRRSSNRRLIQITSWLDRIGRGLALLGALSGLFVVAREIVRAKPGVIAPLAIGIYLILLLILGLALRVGLGRRRPAEGTSS